MGRITCVGSQLRVGGEVSSYYQVFNTATELGTIVFTLFGVHWVMPNTVVDLLAW